MSGNAAKLSHKKSVYAWRSWRIDEGSVWIKCSGKSFRDSAVNKRDMTVVLSPLMSTPPMQTLSVISGWLLKSLCKHRQRLPELFQEPIAAVIVFHSFLGFFCFSYDCWLALFRYIISMPLLFPQWQPTWKSVPLNVYLSEPTPMNA